MDETSGPSEDTFDDPLSAGIRPDEVCTAVAILAELRGVPGTEAYQILVQGAERIQLSVRETARLVVMSPTVADQVAIAS